MEQAKKITGEVEIPQRIVKDIQEKVKNIPDLKKKIEASFEKTTTELLSIILAGAINLDASDIHIEPEEKQAKLRVRVDGILQDVLLFDLKIHKAIVSRIKLLSKLKLNVTDRPQDGRFSILLGATPIEIRASSLPAEYGESIVLRILNPKNLIDVEALGLREDLSKIFNKEIKKPNGMILVTGPTGSGKTTTLYAVLKKLNKPEVKIITIEDPIEYHLKRISQTQVDPKKGYDFAKGLRSIMRQDPDIVLVGEIRDFETAKIALQAALTGHLVLSTLHTNDAAGTIARLQALGEKPNNIAPAINMAIAQRLVRKVCKKCAEFKKISPEDLKKIKKALKGLGKEIKVPELTALTKIPQAKGCKKCNSSGYKGRIGIFEFFLNDTDMEKFILTSPSISSMRELAIKKGMALMRQDGFIKVLDGTTTIEEIERVAAEK
ncbi:GspE/PulE family protein [Patescibacteria group bacterium]|nr:GspE/PulE family protein [Patescibacteria group bacterium]